jgi:hypothetical protein
MKSHLNLLLVSENKSWEKLRKKKRGIGIFLKVTVVDYFVKRQYEHY